MIHKNIDQLEDKEIDDRLDHFVTNKHEEVLKWEQT